MNTRVGIAATVGVIATTNSVACYAIGQLLPNSWQLDIIGQIENVSGKLQVDPRPEIGDYFFLRMLINSATPDTGNSP